MTGCSVQDPCLNGGVCEEVTTGQSVCSCPSEWTGVRCGTSANVGGEGNTGLSSTAIILIAIISSLILAVIIVVLVLAARRKRNSGPPSSKDDEASLARSNGTAPVITYATGSNAWYPTYRNGSTN